jgi:hypothetical protein
MDVPGQAAPTNSAQTAQLRARLGRWQWAVGIIGAVWLASGLGGCLADAISRDDIVDYAAPTFLVSSLCLVAGMIGRRRMRRLLDLQLRRDLAAARRSSEAVLTPTAPLLYPTPAPESPETARLRTQLGGYSPVGVPVLVVSVVAYFLWANDVLLPWSGAVFLVASVALLIVMVVVFTDSRRSRSESAFLASQAHDVEAHLQAVKGEAARTPAAPVLYLRSFADDGSAARRFGALTEEEQLAKALAWVGPLLAVGRPGETLPHVGAQRVYLADEEWQSRVAELMSQARLVVLRTGSTQGFHWEVERALSTLTPDRLLLVADDRRELRAVLGAIARRVGRPESRVWLPGRPIASVKGLVTFGPDWSPRPLRLKRGIWRSSGLDEPLVGRFTLALRPLFDRLGVAYTPPGYSITAVIVAYAIVLLILAGIADYIESLIGAL